MAVLNSEEQIRAEELRLETIAQDYEARAKADPEGPEGWMRYAAHIRQAISRLRDDLRRGNYTIEARDDHCPERGFSPIGTCDTLQEFLERYCVQAGDMTFRLRDDYGDLLIEVTPYGNVGDRWLAEHAEIDCSTCGGTGKVPSERFTHEECVSITPSREES